MKNTISSRADEVIDRCRELARITDVEGQTTRTFLSPAMRRANDLVVSWMQAAGLMTHIDAAGNLRGLRKSSLSTGRTLILASHLDTVPDAGPFDGPLGVLLSLAILQDAGPLPFNVEVIAFSEEEGVRFSFPFIGSRALTGELTEELLNRKDNQGITVRQAIEASGLNIEQLAAAKIAKDHFAYLEFHIEQGPLLESEDRALGVVQAIAGQSRYEFTFTGHANHAGTTPMSLRCDALTAAAEVVLEAERLARATYGLVATVGSLHTHPGAENVIPGETVLTLDLRHADDGIREASLAHLLSFAKSSTTERGISLTVLPKVDQPAVCMDAALTDLLYQAAASSNPLRMTSGAGHDAMILAPHLPSAMLFLRTPGGLSHHPDETVLADDVQLAIETGERFLHLLAAQEAQNA
jgi:allantoate deiminase